MKLWGTGQMITHNASWYTQNAHLTADQPQVHTDQHPIHADPGGQINSQCREDQQSAWISPRSTQIQGEGANQQSM